MEKLSELLTVDPSVKSKKVKKGEIIQQAGKFKAAAYYVKSGLLRSYIIDSKGKEHIYMFAPEGWIIGDLEAMEYNQPVQLHIDCLEEAEVMAFDKDNFLKEGMSKEQIVSNV